ncbi:DUF711 family protein [Chloroflexota bacterium]
MKIRSITLFCDPGWPLNKGRVQQAAGFADEARPAFEAAGIEVQTVRMATPSFARLLPDTRTETVVSFAQALETELTPLGFEYIAIGPALPDDIKSYEAVPAVVAATENIFVSGIMASNENGLSLPAVRACAEIIHALAPQDEVGFANLYFAALANVPPGTPFFPAAYHDGGSPTFAIATEAADLAVAAFTQSNNFVEARKNLIVALESNARKLTSVAESLTGRFADSLNLRFGGLDYSLAPFPEEELSLGTALERLGVPAVGLHGSLAAAAFMTDAVDQANFPRTGFSGLMLPVLEDSTLAARAKEGMLTIKDMLLYSTVCGTGLDTVPLPGDTTVGQLHAVLIDLAALALRLDKPLTARLMPIPGKAAGDLTGFDFAFFANSRVLGLDAQLLTGHLAGDEQLSMKPRSWVERKDQ